MSKYLFYGLLVFSLSCSNTKKMQNAAPDVAKETYVQGNFDKQGHRGCRGLMPENTVPAMLNALGLGVTTLEMDVVITKDKKVILSHEPWFGQEITTKPDGTFIGPREERKYNIYWMTYEEQAKRVSNPQPSVLETDTLPVELLAYLTFSYKSYAGL